jgi:hypothetical protein
MAANKIRKFRRIEEAMAFLNGAVVGGGINKGTSGGSVPAANMVGIPGLVGTTLIFTEPASHTVTFATCGSGTGGSADPTTSPPGTNPDPHTLMFKDIKAQVEAVMTGIYVLLTPDQQLLFIEKTPTDGITISKTGTANALLGLDDDADSVGVIYTPAAVSNSPPCWTWAYSGNDNMHDLFTWE